MKYEREEDESNSITVKTNGIGKKQNKLPDGREKERNKKRNRQLKDGEILAWKKTPQMAAIISKYIRKRQFNSTSTSLPY